MECDEKAGRRDAVILEATAAHKVRALVTPDGIRIEMWVRADSIDLPAETLARLHALVERRGG